jgi:hypothetical protein
LCYASLLAQATGPSRRGIKDIFYETRALMGRDFTVRRFATEVLGGAVHPLMLGYIEKGTRFPNESLVRRLAAIRNEDPQELLAVLWRDRMIHAFAKGLLDKLALQHVETGTYLRNHYLHIDHEQLPEFQQRLDEAVKKLADEFVTDKSPRTRFLNLLITSTPF